MSQVIVQSKALLEPRLLSKAIKPVGLVELDMNHAWSKAMITGLIFNRGIKYPLESLTKDHQAILNETTEPVIGHNKYGEVRVATSPAQGLQTPTLNHNIGAGDFTMAVKLTTHLVGTGYGACCANGQYAPALEGSLISTAWGMYWGAKYAANSKLSDYTNYSLVMTRIGNTVYFYKNGVADGSADVSAKTMTNTDFYYMKSKITSGNLQNGDYEYIYFLKKGLTAKEALSLHLDPYQILKPVGSVSDLSFIGAASAEAAAEYYRMMAWF